ncbi:beta 1-4 rhamnosyltransferase Cps2T [Lacticaseibacillus sp. N501-2]|uniref:beta 1-4 rhamnosyltransferase Cps2T n=1 Tax=Lacticaseibacillus salsurae TaxID=3367729 RepID=UPI0038B3CA01
MSNQIRVNGLSVAELPVHKTNPDYHTKKQQVFIVGSKGIPAAYGGFETFVEMLTRLQTNGSIRYHVARLGKDTKRYEHNGAKCFDINVPEIGPAKAIYYDVAALRHCIRYCQARPEISHPIFYVLACRIGPFIGYFAKEIHALGGKLYVNPDGHEWKRAKWSAPVRRYWKYSERLMVKHADLLVCDSKNIEAYIRTDYRQYRPKTTFIAYGADTKKSILTDENSKLLDWYAKHRLSPKNYYLVVGRFVPENNFETMIKEFMKSRSTKDFAIITTSDEEFLNKLEKKLHFKSDPRIKFVGTVYDTELLKKIREQAYGYFHGHEVGGTNPSLLEALGSTDLNLLLNVGFNREVAEDAAYYWNKDSGSLSQLVNHADELGADQIHQLGEKAKMRINQAYSWEKIAKEYEDLFDANVHQ